MKYLFLAILLLLPVTAFAQHGHAPAKEAAPVLLTPGLGDIDHPVSTSNAEAQKFFNQGLAYIYAFNHEEAIRAFKQAAKLDPQLAMAHWGTALALGSNYNVQADGPALVQAYSHLQKAIELAPKASDHERAYIEALSKRYSSDVQADQTKLAGDYKNAMGELAKRYPDDLDAATLYAESMMNLRPWKLWSHDGKPAPETLEIDRKSTRLNSSHGYSSYAVFCLKKKTDQRDGDGGREEHRGRHVQGEAGAGAAAERRVRDARDDGEQRRGGERRTEQDAVRRPAGGDARLLVGRHRGQRGAHGRRPQQVLF